SHYVPFHLNGRCPEIENSQLIYNDRQSSTSHGEEEEEDATTLRVFEIYDETYVF
ncbi:hypothetical protein HAX54_024957, partial [Datura stramonium]|nr:hypothetical protein [Datura stramonium]